MADPIIRYCATTLSNLNNLDVVDGQLIFVHDARKICLDVNGTRTEYSQIMVLTDEEHREGLKPIPGFYFVLSTNIFWRYEEDWIPLTASPREIVVFSNELPQNGVEETLYIHDTKMYKFEKGNYIELGAPSWGDF